MKFTPKQATRFVDALLLLAVGMIILLLVSGCNGGPTAPTIHEGPVVQPTPIRFSGTYTIATCEGPTTGVYGGMCASALAHSGAPFQMSTDLPESATIAAFSMPITKITLGPDHASFRSQGRLDSAKLSILLNANLVWVECVVNGRLTLTYTADDGSVISMGGPFMGACSD